MLLASKLHKEMEKYLIPEEFIGKTITRQKMSRILNKVLKPLGGTVNVIVDTGVSERLRPHSDNVCYISGWFDDRENVIDPLHVIVHTTQKGNHVTFTKASFNRFLFRFSRVAQHEFIHRIQFSHYNADDKRVYRVSYSPLIGKRRKAWIEYLNDWWEVETHSHDIAMEIAWKYPTKKVETVLKHIDKYRGLSSYNSYKWAFEGLEWFDLKKTLLKKVLKWSPAVRLPKLVT